MIKIPTPTGISKDGNAYIARMVLQMSIATMTTSHQVARFASYFTFKKMGKEIFE